MADITDADGGRIPTSDPKPETPGPKPAPRRRWLRALGCLLFTGLGLLLVAFLVAPYLLAWFGPAMIADRANGMLNGTVEIGAIDWWWGRPATLSGVKLRIAGDPEDAPPALELSEARVPLGIGSLLLNNTLVVDGMSAKVKTLSIRRRADGTWNWQNLFVAGGQVPSPGNGRVPTSGLQEAPPPPGGAGQGGGFGESNDRSVPAPTAAALKVMASGTFEIAELRVCDEARPDVVASVTVGGAVAVKGIENGIEFDVVIRPSGAAESASAIQAKGALGLVNGLTLDVEWNAAGVDLARNAPLVDVLADRRPTGSVSSKGKFGFRAQPRRLSCDATLETRGVVFGPGSAALGRVPRTDVGRVPTSSLQENPLASGDTRRGGDSGPSGDRSVPAPTGSSESKPQQPPFNPQSKIQNPKSEVPDLTLTAITATGEDGTLTARLTAARSGLDLAAALTVTGFDTPTPSADLTGHGLIDVGQIDSATRDLLDIRPDVPLEGLLTFDATAKAACATGSSGSLQAEKADATLKIALDNFAVRDPDGARRPLEPALRAEVVADYDRAAGRCTITKANLDSQAIQIQAHGAIEGVGPAPDGSSRALRVSDSKVTAHADLDRLQRQCAAFLRWAVDTKLAGTLDVNARLSGTATEAGGTATLDAHELHLTNIPVGSTRRSLGPLAAHAELEGTLALAPEGTSRLTKAVLRSDPVDGEATATVNHLLDPAGGADLTLDTTFTLRPERVMATLGDWLEGLRLSGDPVTVHVDTRGTSSDSTLKVTLATVQAAITGGPLAERTVSARDASVVCEASLNRVASKAVVRKFTFRSVALDVGFVGTLDAGAEPHQCDGTIEWNLHPDAAAADLRTWLPDWEFRGESLHGTATYAGTSQAGKGKCMMEGGMLALRKRGEAVDRLKADHFGAQFEGEFDRAADRLLLSPAAIDTEWAGATLTADLLHPFALRSDDPDTLKALQGRVTLDAEGEASRILAAVRTFTGQPASGEAAGMVHLKMPAEARDGKILYDITIDGKDVGVTGLAFGETRFDAAPGEVLLRCAGLFTPGRDWANRFDAFEWRGAGAEIRGSGSFAGSGTVLGAAEAKFSATLGSEPLLAAARSAIGPDATVTGRAVTLQGTVRRQGEGWSVTANGAAPELSMAGGRIGPAGIVLRDAKVDLDAAYDGAPAADTLTIVKGEASNGGATLSLKGRLDRVSVPKEMAADVTLTFSGDLATLFRDYPGLVSLPAGKQATGRLNVDAGIRGTGGALTFAGAVSCTDFVFTSPELKDHPVREGRVGLDVETALSFEPFAMDIHRGTLSSETMHGTLSGGLTVQPDTYEFRRFVLDMLYVPDRLGPILSAFVPGLITGKEEQTLKLSLDGRMTGAELRARLREATATVQIGFGAYTLEGLEMSGAPLALEVRNGRMPLNQVLNVNRGTMTLGGMVDFREAPPAGAAPEAIATQVSMKVENAQIHQDMGPLLSRINPIFYTVGGTLEGTLNSDLALRYGKPFTTAEEFRKVVLGEGTLGIQNLKITGSPLLGEILMQLGTAGAEAVGGGKLEPITLTLQNGRLSYSQMTVIFGVTPLHFRGSVGLDDTLDLEMGFPFSQSMLNRNPALADWVGTELWVPIHGKVTSPRVEWDDLFRNLLKQAAQRAAAKALERLLGGDKDKDGKK